VRGSAREIDAYEAVLVDASDGSFVLIRSPTARTVGLTGLTPS
jgi:hypothetical protein